MTPDKIEETLFTLAALAEKETMARFRMPLAIDNKLDRGFDPVTQADQQAEAAIREWLGKKYPDHGIIGEEYGTKNPDAEYCWVLDPVDGTRAFISGLPGWGTLIGLYHLGKPLAGMMAQPFTGEIFYTSGSKSYLQLLGKKSRLETSNVPTLSNATLMTTDRFIITGTDGEAFDRVKSAAKLTRYGYDCYAYAMVAAGHIDLVIETGLNSYDIAALIPVIEQAGGVVANWQGQSAKNGGRIVAAANNALLKETLELLNP